MIKISKITDYGLVLLTHFVQSKGERVWTAKELAQVAKIPQPTVGKILKLLSRGEILESTRGSLGGYKLTKDPSTLSLAQIIDVLEGRLAVTQCGDKTVVNQCGIQHVCPNRTNWQKINHLIHSALGSFSLADMASPMNLNMGRMQNGSK